MTPLRVDSVTIFKIRSHGCGVLNSETACNSPQSATQHLLYLVLQHALFFRTETRKRSDQLTTANQMGQHLTPKSRRKRRNLKTSDSFGPSSSPKDWFSLSCCFFPFAPWILVCSFTISWPFSFIPAAWSRLSLAHLSIVLVVQAALCLFRNWEVNERVSLLYTHRLLLLNKVIIFAAPWLQWRLF